jgi:succinoglycan biosynthesis transport protein ExoP
VRERGPILADDPRTIDWRNPPEEELGLKRYLQTIRDRLGLVILATAVTTVVAVAYVLVASKTYEAEADLLITPVASDTLPSLPLIRQSADPTRDVETAARLVTNTEVARRVKAQLDLSETPQDVLKDVSAEPVAQSNIVAVQAEADTRAGARDLANAFASNAVDEQTDKVHSEIDDQVSGIQAQLQAGGPQPTLSARLAELQALATGPDPTIRVETAAELPQDAAKPRPTLTVVGGILAGLVIGIVAAFAAQILDTRLRREDQLRRAYSLPILARVPKEGTKRDRPLGPRNLSAAAAEAYRTLRATISSGLEPTKAGQVILVTGSGAGEGKSTTAVNLASSLALTGKEVILIEADLRRPSLGSVLGLEPTRGGVVSVLIEHTAISRALVSSSTYGPNLRCLLADQAGTGWVTDLFSIPAADTMVKEAARLADYVVIDSPPLNEVIDALPLARQADDVLMVARIGTTRLDKLAQLSDLLAESGIKPIGFAVVGSRRPGRRDYRYYTAPATAEDQGRPSPLVSGDPARAGAGRRT